MKGKICVVTGSNSGIGYETALALASKNADVTMICRNVEKGEAALQRIREATSNKNVRLLTADLSRQADIRKVAQQLRDQFEHIDVLVNNAGTWVSKLTFTEDNVETVFAVNHIAYFLMVQELLPLLKNAQNSRIVCVGSDSHFQVKRINFDDISLGKKYNGMKSYAQSKLANSLFVYEQHRRLRSEGIENVDINCVQPGLVKTDIGLKNTISLHALVWKIRRSGGVTPAEGAATSIYLASHPDASGQSGLYWDKCKPKSSSKGSYDETAAKRLWEVCEQLTMNN